jgi:hypothetical protein
LKQKIITPLFDVKNVWIVKKGLVLMQPDDYENSHFETFFSTQVLNLISFCAPKEMILLSL